MNNNTFSFLLTLLAGISTIIGYFIIYIKKNNYQKIITCSLSFAAGVMICTSITDLIPEAIKLFSKDMKALGIITLCILGIIFGIVISMIIDYYIPDDYNNENKNLYRVGILSMIAIILHNIPEGIITFIAAKNNRVLGLSLALAIAMHNIPEGITISIPIYYSTKNKKLAFIYTLISALSEPLGALIAYIILDRIMTDLILGIILSMVAGVMLNISFKTLLPNVKKYNDRNNIILFIILGFLFMCLKFLF